MGTAGAGIINANGKLGIKPNYKAGLFDAGGAGCDCCNVCGEDVADYCASPLTEPFDSSGPVDANTYFAGTWTSHINSNKHRYNSATASMPGFDISYPSEITFPYYANKSFTSIETSIDVFSTVYTSLPSSGNLITINIFDVNKNKFGGWGVTPWVGWKVMPKFSGLGVFLANVLRLYVAGGQVYERTLTGSSYSANLYILLERTSAGNYDVTFKEDGTEIHSESFSTTDFCDICPRTYVESIATEYFGVHHSTADNLEVVFT